MKFQSAPRLCFEVNRLVETNVQSFQDNAWQPSGGHAERRVGRLHDLVRFQACNRVDIDHALDITLKCVQCKKEREHIGGTSQVLINWVDVDESLYDYEVALKMVSYRKGLEDLAVKYKEALRVHKRLPRDPVVELMRKHFGDSGTRVSTNQVLANVVNPS